MGGVGKDEVEVADGQDGWERVEAGTRKLGRG